MLLQAICISGLLLGVVLLAAGLIVRKIPPWEQASVRAADLLIAVALILVLGSLSVFLLIP